ncbi:MAG: acyl-CoA dehydrogenase family protein, partial [Myxococcales bacterium]|nr:acyl-CoA dehydrogenase family protein [Myxococcales bacterium]
MDARLDEEQERLRDAAREFLSRECPMSFVREMMEDPAGITAPVWKQLAELGWTGLVVPEAHGGAGLGWLDLAVLFEETGAALLPGPLFSTVALGGNVIARAGTPAQHERWLPRLAAGELRATLALQE